LEENNMTKLVDRLKKSGRNIAFSAVMAASALAVGGCGGTNIVGRSQDVPSNCNDDGAYSTQILDWYEMGSIGDNYLMCPVACPPEYRDGDDPITAFINIKKQERWDYERSYYQTCIEDVRKGRPIPARETLAAVSPDFINKLMDYQLEWIKERAKISAAEAEKAIRATEKAEKELEKLALLKGAWAHDSVQQVVVAPGDQKMIINMPHYFEGGAITNLEGLIGKGHQIKIVSAGLDIEDQRKICNGDNSSVAEVIALPQLDYIDCKHRPKDALNNGEQQYYGALEQKIPQLKSGEYVLLSCGNATTKSAHKCEYDPKDTGNADVSWKRAYFALSGAVYRFKEKLEGVGMAAFMNRTALNERTAKVYLVKKNAVEQKQ
jgi:hypothetical protein